MSTFQQEIDLNLLPSSRREFLLIKCLPLGLRPNLEYLNTVEKQYGERPSLMSGAREIKSVNDWFRQQTGGKVDRILGTAMPRNPTVVPVGAAYFKG